jgi:hypothetical protein
MRSLITLFSFVASACAYQIISPSNTSGWTTLGRNNVTWQRVNTDAATFTMLLVNQVRSPSLTLFSSHLASFSSISGQELNTSRPGNSHCDGRRHTRHDRYPRT